MEQGAMSWHAFCDTVVTFSPTTPVVSLASGLYDEKFCLTEIYGACASARNELKQCSEIKENRLLSACMCDPQLIRQAYSCEYIGNISCLATPAALSNMVLSSGCPDFAAVVASAVIIPFTRFFTSQLVSDHL
jgi:hypothetical protein